MRLIGRYIIIVSVFVLLLNGSVFKNTTIDEKKVVKELNKKIAYFEDLKKQKEKRLSVIERDIDKNLNKVLNLSAEIKEINKKIYAIKLKRDDRVKVIKKIEESLKFVDKKDISKEYKTALKHFSKGDIKKASKYDESDAKKMMQKMYESDDLVMQKTIKMNVFASLCQEQQNFIKEKHEEEVEQLELHAYNSLKELIPEFAKYRDYITEVIQYIRNNI